jgi:hypothetical protein
MRSLKPYCPSFLDSSWTNLLNDLKDPLLKLFGGWCDVCVGKNGWLPMVLEFSLAGENDAPSGGGEGVCRGEDEEIIGRGLCYPGRESVPFGSG